MNKYPGDYDALRAALRIGKAAPGRRRSREPAPPRAGLRCRASDITEIQLRRTACLGPCPVYTATLRRDGTAEWDGRDHVDRLGHYEGQVGRRDFDRLAEAVVLLRFFAMADQYPPPATDLPSTVTTVTWDGGDKTVDRSCNQGPTGLWMLETLIDGVAAGVRWKRADQREAR